MSQDKIDIAEQLNQDTNNDLRELRLRSATVTLFHDNMVRIAQHPNLKLTPKVLNDILELINLYSEALLELRVNTSCDSQTLDTLIQNVPSRCKLTLLGRLTPPMVELLANNERLKHLCLDADMIPAGSEYLLLASQHLHSLDLRGPRFSPYNYIKSRSRLFSANDISHIARCIEERDMFSSCSITELYYDRTFDNAKKQLPEKIASKLLYNQLIRVLFYARVVAIVLGLAKNDSGVNNRLGALPIELMIKIAGILLFDKVAQWDMYDQSDMYDQAMNVFKDTLDEAVNAPH